MSVETLRRVAALMRERALVAAQTYEVVPARVDIDREGTCDACAEEKWLVASYPEPGNDPWLCVHCAVQADYDASWHPAVALAVADWLDDHAETAELFVAKEIPASAWSMNWQTSHNHALAVANAYLQEVST